MRNAVLILHGTGGTGGGFLSQTFGGELFGAGQILDATRYFIILPDGIGHGKSTKPSDGLHARFPKYTYDDMVRAQHAMLVDGLKVNHLRLVLGTSMGAMHCWVWGEMYPDFVDGLVPLASAPTQIAGRNRVMRTMIMDSITHDPAWKNGEYTEPPRAGLVGADQSPDDDDQQPAAVAQVGRRRATPPTSGTRIRSKSRLAATDANDMLYQFNASRDYDPSPNLEKITAHAARHQLGRRCGEPAGAGADGEADAAREARTLRADPDQRTDPRPRHALAAGDLGQVPRGVPEGARRRRPLQ